MFQKKVVVITGASGGIGKTLTLKFGEAGARLILWDLEFSEKYLKELKEKKFDFIFEKINITEKTEIEKGVKKILEKWQRIDILINNAGITRDKIIFRMEEEDWQMVFDVNLKGSFLCSKIIGRVMFSRKIGKIVNVASIIGQIGNKGQANYSASKGGLIAFTKTCAKEFARANINVNAIAPGYILTKMTENLSEKTKNEMFAKIPLQRFGTTEEVAELILFLASEKANYITGQVFRIDGGLVM